MTHQLLGGAVGRDSTVQSAEAAARISPRFLIPLTVIVLLFTAVITAVSWIRLPVPEGAVHLTEVEVSLDGAVFQPATLPHRWPAAGPHGNVTATYRGVMTRTPGESAVLLIPGIRHEMDLLVDGQRVQPNASGLRRNSSLGATHVVHLSPVDRDI